MGWNHDRAPGDSDEALYERVRGGDMGAFDRLYARHERPLFGFIRRCLGPAERGEAEEVFHDVFLQVMTGAEARFGEAKFTAWLYRSARNTCANWHRGHARRARAVGELRLAAGPPTDPSGDGDGPELRFLEAERSAALSRAVERLPVGLAEVFALRSAGLSYAEIAEELRLPLGTVKSRLHTLVAQLKEVLRLGAP